MKFSVLISMYHKEKAEYFNRAMKSIWDEQTIKPNEIVLVQDGPLTDTLYKEVEKWKIKLGYIFKIIALDQNVGLGDALNIGLKKCCYKIIARMDTDDISLPNRFKKQLDIFKSSDIDVCSSWVSEFDTDENEIISFRKLPEIHDDIVKFGKKRNPLNHPAVMYKKSVVEKVGSYKKMMWFEDYYLWSRMILNGAKFYNIQEPLVNMRAGYGQLERRSGLKYAIAEIVFLKELYKIHFLNLKEYLVSISIRLIARVLPRNLVKIIYKIIRS